MYLLKEAEIKNWQSCQSRAVLYACFIPLYDRKWGSLASILTHVDCYSHSLLQLSTENWDSSLYCSPNEIVDKAETMSIFGWMHLFLCSSEIMNLSPAYPNMLNCLLAHGKCAGGACAMFCRCQVLTINPCLLRNGPVFPPNGIYFLL